MRGGYITDGICRSVVINGGIYAIGSYTLDGCGVLINSKLNSLGNAVIVIVIHDTCAEDVTACRGGNCGGISRIVCSVKLIFILESTEGLILCCGGSGCFTVKGPSFNSNCLYGYERLEDAILKRLTSIFVAVIPDIVIILKVKVYVICVYTCTAIVSDPVILCFGINYCCGDVGADVFKLGFLESRNGYLKLFHSEAYLAVCALVVSCSSDLGSYDIVACCAYNSNLIALNTISKILIIFNSNCFFTEYCVDIGVRYRITVDPFATVEFVNAVISLNDLEGNCCLSGGSVVAPNVVGRVIKNENYVVIIYVDTTKVTVFLYTVEIV